MATQFWKFVKDEVSSSKSELILDGPIAGETWYGDEVTPALFREELAKHTGDLTVRINSPGGDVYAGVSIYNMLKDHEGSITVIVEALAASIASVIAMAGDKIIMNTGSMMMVHKPWTFAAGNSDELRQAAEYLEKVGNAIVPIYTERTGKSEEEIVALLEGDGKGDGTWMTAQEAVDLGFADEAVKGKSSLTEMVNNALNSLTTVQSAVLQPAMSLKAKLEVPEVTEDETKEVEETNVTDTTEADAGVSDEETKPTDATEVTEEVEEVEVEIAQTPQTTEVTPEPTELVETVAEEQTSNATTKETNMSATEIAKDQVLEPKAQAPVEATPKASVKDYLKTKDAMEVFARILEANPGTKENADDASTKVQAAWKQHLETKLGVTNPEIFLPQPVVTTIEDAFETSEIFSRVSKTGLDVFSAAWDANDDPDAESGRAAGYNRSLEEEKREQSLTFANRVLRPQMVYKYITLNAEDVKEQRSTGALVRFVLSELPKRIIREIERAIVTGDGRAPGSDYKIQEGSPRGFYPVKADATAGNVFASTYVPVEGQTVYETLRRARALIKAEGSVLLVAKEGLLLDMEFEQNVNGGFLFAPGSDLARYVKVDAVVEPDWMEDDENDAYMFVTDKYRVVGDQSVEAFTNFLLKTNKHEYLQEIWAGGGLTARKSGVAIAASPAS